MKKILSNNKNKNNDKSISEKTLSYLNNKPIEAKKSALSSELDLLTYNVDNKKIFKQNYENINFFRNIKPKYIKHFLPFNKEWKNTVYLFDKNDSSLDSNKHESANDFIKSYFNLVPFNSKKMKRSKRMRDYLRRSKINNIYISNSEIKQTNDKLFVTLFIFDRKKKHFLNNLYFSNKYLKNIIYTKKHKVNNNLPKKQIKYLKQYIKKNLNKKLKKQNNYKLSVSTNIKKRKRIFYMRNKKNSRTRKNLIRKSLKQYRFNIINFYNIKKNIINKFYKNFYIKFIILFLNYFNIKFTFNKKKIILNWPKNHYIINNHNDNNNSQHNQFNNKDMTNIFYLTNYAQKFLSKLTSIKYCLINIFHSKEKNKLILNDNSGTYNYNIDSLFKHNNLTTKNKKNKQMKSIQLFSYKSKLFYLIMIYLAKKIVDLNFISLYGKTFTKKYIITMWNHIFTEYYNNFIKEEMQDQILNLNKILFDKDVFFYRRNKQMSVLKNILEKIYNKKSILNVINVKYLQLNSDNYMEALKKKLKNRTSNLSLNLKETLNLIKLPKKINTSSNTLKKKSIYNTTKKILNNIKYKYVTGVKLEAKGRLTKRYTASRSVFKFKFKGNLRNLEYSKKHPTDLKRSPNLHLIRGIIKPNIQFTKVNGTRRIGVFGLKGWISGN